VGCRYGEGVWQGKNADPEKGITVGEGGQLGREKREWKSGEIISARRHRSNESDEAPERFVKFSRHELIRSARRAMHRDALRKSITNQTMKSRNGSSRLGIG
jgi:hypothetical protein